MTIIRGTARGETLTGDRNSIPEADTILGLGGDDFLFGLGADDTLEGGVGNDGLDGGEGNDTLNGGDGRDKAGGGAGNDTINGGNGDDSLTGGVGSDRLLGGAGADSLADTFEGETTDENWFDGGAGDDFLQSGVGVNTLIGGAGNDNLVSITVAGHVSSKMFGVNRSATRPGQGERDILRGGAGVDQFYLGEGQKVFYNDGSRTSAGIRDYALIADADFAAGDRILVSGAITDYSFGASPVPLPIDGSDVSTAVFWNRGQTRPELIAIVTGVSTLAADVLEVAPPPS